jgi:hypothetical protein
MFFRHRFLRRPATWLILSLVPAVSFAETPNFDRSATPGLDAGVAAGLQRLQSDPTLRRLGRVASIDERHGVPNFVWSLPAGPRPAGAAAAQTQPSHESAARATLERLAPLYGLDRRDVREAPLRYVHDTGRGGIIVAFTQRVAGVDVFRDEIKVLMDRTRQPLATSGFIPSQGVLGRGGVSFRLPVTDAIVRALEDFAGQPVPRGTLRATDSAHGYERFLPGAEVAGVAKLSPEYPIRARKVLFHVGSTLVPGWHVELAGPAQAFSYVFAADDGSLLFRHSLMETDAFSYRVWADGTAAHTPLDGPQGTAPTPHPTGVMSVYAPPFVAPSLISLQNSPFSMNDPWLPAGATQTTGNNVDAYADLVSPDGFNGGDLRATTTSPGIFDRAYNPALAPNASATQQMAAVTQLFFTNNFLHDWFYDAGFDEASGNAQSSNFGRGGFGGDPILAEAQDFGGLNNANMFTPADGASPRMQMYVFTPPGNAGVIVNATGISGARIAGAAVFGPQTFSVTGALAVAIPNDGCAAITNGAAVSGKVALIDRGSCDFSDKVGRAQTAGAIGVLIVNNVPNEAPPAMGGTGPTITIPSLSISKELGDSLEAALLSGAVTVTLDRPAEVNRDGTIDNQVVTHEWGHYISNRLTGGLVPDMARALGEGWGDFHSLLLTVRPEDVSAPANANFSGVYTMGGYSIGGVYAPAYYFGYRRMPYTTDMSKNGFTFKHIEDGVALPAGAPMFILSTENSEVHNAGEIWCTMLWECYAALLNDTGRLTFAQAQLRMRDYLVASYKLTPSAPTFTEARDALLAAARANDVADYVLFWNAFAKRGAGMGAVSPDRNSTTFAGVVESFIVGGDLEFVSVTLDDDVASCDHDGYLDEGETGTLTVTLLNTGAVDLASTTGSISSTHPAVTFPSGTTLSFSSSTPYALATATIPVKLQGSSSSLQVLDFQVSFGDPAQVTTNPQFATETMYGRGDEVPSATETAEEQVLGCIPGGDPVLDAGPWQRLEVTPTSHVLFGPDPTSKSDQWIETPNLNVAPAGSFTFTFTHRFSFERSGGTRYDGGVIELSNNGGASWIDIGASASPGYNGTITTTSGNPLGGRAAYTSTNTGYPSTANVTVNLGTTYAGQTVRVRFRIGTDESVGAPGWEIDNLAFTNLTNQPFMSVLADPDVCAPTAVEEGVPGELAFAIESAVPTRGDVRLGFALPAATQVDVAVFDVAGRRVATLARGAYEAGRHAAVWRRDATTGSGVYFARMTAGQRSLLRRVVVLP